MVKENFNDIDKMAKIIVCLIEKFGKDSLVEYLLDRLIRHETDYLSPSYKSTKVAELEKDKCISLIGLSRKQIYQKNKDMSKLIVIEHGFPEKQAISMCFEKPNMKKVKTILEDVKTI